MDGLARLAELIRARNANGAEITGVIGRPAEMGHVGEHIASAIFAITLERSASHKAYDGHFTESPLSGKSVNIKWYAKRENVLDINLDQLPDFYLVLAGPKSPAVSSRGEIRPWVIHSVHLFDVVTLIPSLSSRHIQIGIATSIAQEYWEQVEIYPNSANPLLSLTDQQNEMLALFR